MNKLIIAIIRDDDNERVSARLTAEDFRVTQIASTGGFLRSGRSTLLIGVEEARVSRRSKSCAKTAVQTEVHRKRKLRFLCSTWTSSRSFNRNSAINNRHISFRYSI